MPQLWCVAFPLHEVQVGGKRTLLSYDADTVPFLAPRTGLHIRGYLHGLWAKKDGAAPRETDAYRQVIVISSPASLAADECEWAAGKGNEHQIRLDFRLGKGLRYAHGIGVSWPGCRLTKTEEGYNPAP